MRFGNIFKLLLLTAAVIILSVIPALGSTENDSICIEISEYCIFGDSKSATVMVNCNDIKINGIVLILEFDSNSEFYGAENLHSEACLTAVCKNDRCVLMWDSENNTDYNGKIARINFCGGFKISYLSAWSNLGFVPIVYDSHIKNMYEISKICPELWQVTQYKKYTPDEFIDTEFCDGCFLSVYADGVITVGLINYYIGNMPDTIITEYLSDMR